MIIIKILQKHLKVVSIFPYFTVCIHLFYLLLQSEGLSKFNKIYQFQHNIDGHQCDMKMTSVSGHLLNYDFEERYRKNWHSCRPSQLFDLPVVKRCNDEFGLKIKVTCTYICTGCVILK